MLTIALPDRPLTLRCCLLSISSSTGVTGGSYSLPHSSGKWKLTTNAISQRKQFERATTITNLPAPYHASLSDDDRDILGRSVEELVQDVHRQALKPIDILRSYGKVAIKAHAKTNCLTEVMLPAAERWANSEVNLNGPLAGIPISLKDSIAVGGFDVSVGYSCNTGKPYAHDGIMVKILKDAGS